MAKTKEKVDKEKVAEKEAEKPAGTVSTKDESKPEVVKSKEQIEAEANETRKAAVDAANEKAMAEAKAAEAKLAKIPLNDEEKAFIAMIKPKMNQGRKIMRPSPADILRYSQLIKRINVKG